jgi:hypothetical protein
MSYCRKNGENSDLYVVGTGDAWECLGCSLIPKGERNEAVWGLITSWFICDTRQEMLNHVLAHRAEGHKVPEKAIRRLRKEIREEHR